MLPNNEVTNNKKDSLLQTQRRSVKYMNEFGIKQKILSG
jgi:hypothetical protein